MGVFGGPEIPNDGLVLVLDGANYKSFKGEVTTNLIPNPTVNAYPTTGNAWGTYNTNQYNGAQYFSIGSIVSVSGNVITTSGNHPLRTYDVMNPQTTGGGVNAGTNYFIKKVSDTSFTLHEYNGSQDGSQGYINPSTGNHKVYDSIANDTRISVNSTNFPTMWWGYAHQPNSGLVKELRYGEFNAIPNLPANDCIRLHYIRTDDVKDGMSYGVDCTVTPSSPVTVSFYTRAANANAVGKVIQYQIYNYSGGSPTGYAWNFALGQVGVWERQTFTFTPANSVIISYWFPQSSGVYSWDWSCMQVEQKSYVTSFIAGTRGTTVATGGGWEDLIGNGNNGELVNGVRESSANGGSLVFDGVDDYVNCGSPSTLNFGTGNFNLSCWVNIPSTSGADWIGIISRYVSGVGFWIQLNPGNRYVGFGWDGSNYITSSSSAGGGQWKFISCQRTGSTSAEVYVNGISVASSSSMPSGTSNGQQIDIGRIDIAGRYSAGNIAQVSIYNRALTATEIQQNFNATRGRFGI